MGARGASNGSKKTTPLVSLAQARANKSAIDWATYTPPLPRFIGRRVFRNQGLAELAACIGWGVVQQGAVGAAAWSYSHFLSANT